MGSSNDRVVKAPEGYFSRVDTSKPCIGVVKENIDEEKMGRLRVWIQGSTAPENDPSGWIWVNYCTPFGGATNPDTLGNSVQNYDDTQKSYGFWATPPDIGNEVIVIFVNGDVRQGFWIGCLFHKNMNHMVPGISEGNAYQSNEQEFVSLENPGIPVSEYNKLSNNPNQRPYYEPLAQGLTNQGLLEDDLRGAGTSSARRESPSKVHGLLTPGGNQLVLDDGENSELIRIRTKSGAQILVSETFGHIYVITKDGNSWLEVNNGGFIDLYGSQDISIRSEGSLNLRADKNINMEAGQGINLKSLGSQGLKVHAPDGDIDMAAQNARCTIDTNLDLKSGSQFRVRCEEQMSFSTEENINFVGDTITSNTGPGSLPDTAQTPSTTSKLDKDTTPDGLVDVNIDTILSRVPHHEPWPDHAEALLGTRELVEEGDTFVKKGSISSTTESPLPIIGTPRQGMQEGVYEPVGYAGDEPQYSFVGSSAALKNVNELSISDEGLLLITRFEGFSSNVYRDSAGKATIGYGHLIKQGESFPDGIGQEQALELLRQDVATAENAIRRNVNVKLTQNQFDALTSFVFNVGSGNFAKSTLLKELNQGNYSEVPNQLVRWNKATVDGEKKEIRGLTARRRNEGLIFSTPIED